MVTAVAILVQVDQPVEILDLSEQLLVFFAESWERYVIVMKKLSSCYAVYRLLTSS